MEDIILLGTGGHAHSVVDTIEQTEKYHIVGFLDIEKMLGKVYKDYFVLGTDADMRKYYDRGIRNAFITVGFIGCGDIRERLYQQLKDIGYRLPNIVDHTAIVSGTAQFGEGVFVGKKAVINAGAKIGNMCIINTGAIIEHDCEVGDFSHIAVGSVLCGEVTVGKKTLVGANATVIQKRKIGNCCLIGAASVICKDVEDDVIRYGKIEKLRGAGE